MTIKKWINFLLYSNIFISICAAALTVETYLLVHSKIDPEYVFFSFFSTLVFYGLPSMFFAKEVFSENEAGRIKWIHENKNIIAVSLLFGIIGTAITLFFFPLKFMVGFAPIALLAFAYFVPQTGIRRVMGVKAGIVAVVWTSVTAIYPLIVITGYDFLSVLKGANGIIVLQNFLFVFPLCVIYNVRDIDADNIAGVRTFPSIYGLRITIAICIASLLLFSFVVFYFWNFSATAFLLFLPALISAILIMQAGKEKHDYYYSFLIDGMMLLKGILAVISSMR